MLISNFQFPNSKFLFLFFAGRRAGYRLIIAAGIAGAWALGGGKSNKSAIPADFPKQPGSAMVADGDARSCIFKPGRSISLTTGKPCGVAAEDGSAHGRAHGSDDRARLAKSNRPNHQVSLHLANQAGNEGGGVQSPSLPTKRTNGPSKGPPPAPERPVRRSAVYYRIMTVTAYCPCRKCCGRFADGITASGRPVTANQGRFVAAPASIPFYTCIRIPGYNDGLAVPVLDRGGAVKGARLDVFFPTHAEALAWGRKTLKVEIQSTTVADATKPLWRRRENAENAEVRR